MALVRLKGKETAGHADIASHRSAPTILKTPHSLRTALESEMVRQDFSLVRSDSFGALKQAVFCRS